MRARSQAGRSSRRRQRTVKVAKLSPGRPPRYLLRLYITGVTPASLRAVENARAICREHLGDRYELEVYDIYQMPALARDHQIIAAPTLVKVLPVPLRRFVGDLSKLERVLFGLDLREGR